MAPLTAGGGVRSPERGENFSDAVSMRFSAFLEITLSLPTKASQPRRRMTVAGVSSIWSHTRWRRTSRHAGATLFNWNLRQLNAAILGGSNLRVTAVLRLPPQTSPH